MKHSLISCIMLIVFTLNTIAQKLEVLKENDSYFLIDKLGKTNKSEQYSFIFPCTYSKDIVIADQSNPLLVNLLSGKIVVLDEITEYLNVNSDSCLLTPKDLLRFKLNKKIGLMSFPDKIILPAEFDEIIPKADVRDFFILKKGKNYQFYYPQSGKYSNSFQWDKSSDLYFDNGLCYLPDKVVFFAKSEGKPVVMKTDGTQYILDKIYTNGTDLNQEGISPLLAIQNGKYGFIDGFANVVVPFRYDEAKVMDNISFVKYKGKYGLIGQDGNEIIPCAYDKLEMDKIEYMRGTKEGKVVFFGEGGYPSEQLIISVQNNKYGFATQDEKTKIACEYDTVYNFSVGTAAVKKGGKWGYILPTGHYIIATQFEDAKSFLPFGIAPVKLKGKWGFVDFEGKFVFEPTYDSVQIQDDFYYRLFKDGGVYLLGPEKNITFVSVLSTKSNFEDPRDGRIYQSVSIGIQTWMSQNLDFKTDESYYFNNDENNGPAHGRLYTWKAALTACPAGWHLPSDIDWQILEKSIGMPDVELNSTYYIRGGVQAPMLRMGGCIGFNIQMSGFLHGYDNNFYKLDDNCILWTSTPGKEGFAYTRSFFPNTDMINRDDNMYVKYALPVRCVKD